MPPRKLNVLVYTGTGTTSESVRHCIFTLRQLLTPNYAVIPVTAALLREPWGPTCALLVVPGGADLEYCRVLNGEGNRRIADYVRGGGSYLGFCAGAYYGSARCEFEVGDKQLEVIGSRELGFFPGTCRGGTFKGFQYSSERGARAARLRVATGAFKDAGSSQLPSEITSYFNGGGVFVDAEALKSRKVEVLATYEDDVDVDGGQGKPAAVVCCTVGNGKVVLCGPHPEFAAENLRRHPEVAGYDKLIKQLTDGDDQRLAFVRACLEKLGLEACDGKAEVPALTSMHLSSMTSDALTEILYAMGSVIDREDGREYIKDDVDTFHLKTDVDSPDLSTLTIQDAEPKASTNGSDGVVDYSQILKVIVPHEDGIPTSTDTPKWDHDLYYSSVRRYQLLEGGAREWEWGNALMYGEVLTSTTSILEKNPKLLSCLPTGFTLAATTQVAGRGRGSNVWIAPPGSLLFSTVINHPAHLAMTRPVVFIQYLAAIATAEAIQSYGQGYQNIPVKLKWPNDIYALDPNSPKDSPTYVKIAGIASHCGYANGAYQVVVGIGINTFNARPTTSISALRPADSEPLHIETLLARVLTRFEALHARFLREGFSVDLEKRYYQYWLHTGQAVTLEAEGGARGRVLGITRDWGMLRVERVDADGRGTGDIWTLQSDENSFDYWRGLVKRKM